MRSTAPPSPLSQSPANSGLGAATLFFLAFRDETPTVMKVRGADDWRLGFLSYSYVNHLMLQMSQE